MAAIDLPPPAELALATGELPAEAPMVFGEHLDPNDYLDAVRTLIDQEVLITTVSERFLSPLNFVLRYSIGPVTLEQFSTRITDISDRRELRFDYEYEPLQLGRPVEAIAPLDRAITKIFLPRIIQ